VRREPLLHLLESILGDVLVSYPVFVDADELRDLTAKAFRLLAAEADALKAFDLHVQAWVGHHGSALRAAGLHTTSKVSTMRFLATDRALVSSTIE
jgi:hypothetical protein